jgi:hypothetical protein
VVLYTREGCCLCDQARELIQAARERVPFAFEERDIERDDALMRAYLERIPVVTVDGVEAFELFVDQLELERIVTGDGSAPGGPDAGVAPRSQRAPQKARRPAEVE